MKKIVVLSLVLSFLAIAGFSLADNSDAEQKAFEAAESWLVLVDDKQYDESWNQAAELFKIAVNQQQWENAIQSVRAPLGSLISREVLSKTYATTLPGAPDGEYVVIQYTTSYQNKQSSVETVTPMKDQDGVWRVSGYFIK